MHLLEVREDFILGDPLFTFETFEVSILAVNIKMLLLVRWLAECHPAALHWTNVRFFQSVGAQMIKEIIPFSEVHLAVFLVARVYVWSATCLRVEEFHVVKALVLGTWALPSKTCMSMLSPSSFSKVESMGRLKCSLRRLSIVSLGLAPAWILGHFFLSKFFADPELYESIFS